MKCPECNEEGKVICPYCHAAQLDRLPCYECNSTGKVICRKCDGTGEKEN